MIAVDDLTTGRIANLGRGPRLRQGVHVLQHGRARRGPAPAVRAPSAGGRDAPRGAVRRPALAGRSGRTTPAQRDGPLNVLECAVRTGVRKVVYAASRRHALRRAQEVPVKEIGGAGVAAAARPYGISKKVALDYLGFYQRYRGLDFTALALGNVYGPRQDPHGEAGVIAIFAATMLAGETPDDLRRRQPDARLRLHRRRRARVRAGGRSAARASSSTSAPGWRPP